MRYEKWAWCKYFVLVEIKIRVWCMGLGFEKWAWSIRLVGEGCVHVFP